MAKPSRWNAEKRYQIVKEALSQKEPMGQIPRRHQVSEGLIYRWRDKFFEGQIGVSFRWAQREQTRESGTGAPGRRSSEVNRGASRRDPFFKTAVEN